VTDVAVLGLARRAEVKATDPRYEHRSQSGRRITPCPRDLTFSALRPWRGALS
jgi:hypothetical protein